tara:strand:+ start:424 stop:585 length:162 start_codon:yes stop_codon:yes gene_type:complete
MVVFARSVAMNESIDDFVDGSGLVECDGCGEVVETVDIDKCPYCDYYPYGDLA